MTQFKAYLVEQQGEKNFTGSIVQRQDEELPEGDVLIRVEYSSLNYKDALSASGNPGVTRNFPHTPGIDAAGRVVESSDETFNADDEVIVIGYDLGMNTSGGFGQLIRVPAGWVVKRPEGLTLKESMILGTAGFTAALCVSKLIDSGLRKEQGEVLVTGATGGVGVVAVSLLSKLGFSVAASTGKMDQTAFLESLGAARVVDRNELTTENTRPLLKEQWAGAVDVAGGNTLFNVIKSLRYGASVAACGLVESPIFAATVFPFILRGVNLLGVDSVNLPIAERVAVWSQLATDWKLEGLNELVTEIGFEQLSDSLQSLLAGQAVGRMVLNLNS